MKTKTCYLYNEGTGELIGQSECQENPKRPGEYLIPEYATLTPPPATQANEIAVWSKDVWQIMEDHRGKTYWTQGKKAVTITEIGSLSNEYITETPPPDDRAEWVNGEWIISLEVLKKRKISEIRSSADQSFAALKEGYSNVEIESWARQENGAHQLRENPDSTQPDASFVRLMADRRGIPLEEMIDKIINRVNIAREKGAKIIGTQQHLEDKVLVATSEDDLKAIAWDQHDFL